MEIIILIISLIVIFSIVKSGVTKKKPPAKPEIKVTFEVSRPSVQVSETERYGRPNGSPAKWLGVGRGVNVQAYSIPGGLVYIGEKLLDTSGYDNDACLINPKLKVIPAEPWDGADEMGYWPHYGRISANCRGAYLKWLAGGRSEPEAYIGYVFLFFYGLERRLFVDGQRGEVTAEERCEIVKETNRLLNIYGDNRSFRGYASNLLAMEWILYQSDKPAPDSLDFNNRYCSEPFQVMLAKQVAAGKPIPADMALQWINLHPEFGLRTPARRCPKEFGALFSHHYKQKFGEGLIVKPNKTPLKLAYHAASSSIRGDLKLNVPDLPNPFILTAPLKRVSELIEQCTTELEPYSRFLARKDNDPNSLAALALLPNELMHECQTVKGGRSYLQRVCENGVELISVNSLYQEFGEKAPLQIGKKESENLANLLEGMGFGMAPDIRFHNLKPSVEGKLAVFPNGHGKDFRPSKEYRTLCTLLRLGAMVSQIDNDVSNAEKETLHGLVNENDYLTLEEKNSLLAFLHWCLYTPQGTAGIKQRLAEVSSVEKHTISRILISVAFADGRIDPKEVKQLEKLYVALGLEKEQVTNDLHTLVASQGPVTVSLKDVATSFSIPKQTVETLKHKGFCLNEELIRIRTEETSQVKDVLERIFSDPVEDRVENEIDVIMMKNPIAELDEAHQRLFNRLLEKDSWERNDLRDMCKELGLMLDGAMEVINEWAFDQANAPLIDDGDPVCIDVDLAREIVNV